MTLIGAVRMAGGLRRTRIKAAAAVAVISLAVVGPAYSEERSAKLVGSPVPKTEVQGAADGAIKFSSGVPPESALSSAETGRTPGDGVNISTYGAVGNPYFADNGVGRPLEGAGAALSVTAIETLDFTPQRHCTADTIPDNAILFSGTGNQLVTAVNTLQSDRTLVINPVPNNGEYIVTQEMAVIGKQNVTICAAPGTRPRIKQTQNAWRIFTVANSNNVIIEGLEIYSINDAAHDQVSGVNALEGAHHVYIWDMWVHDVPACGICSARSMGHNDFRYNRIWNTANYSRYQQSGISLFSNRNGGGPNDQHGYSDYVIGNLIWNSRNLVGRGTDGNCIILDYNKDVQKIPAYTGKFLVANNLCVANGGRGIHLRNSDNADVVNNTLYHDLRAAAKRGTGLDGHQGEISVYSSSNLRIINNLSVAIPFGNVYDTGSTGSNVVLAGNMFNGPTSRHPSSGFTTIDNPMFVGPNENPALPGVDFRPAAGSPVINAGVASHPGVHIPTVDFNGTPRNPAAPSVGAFEPN